MTNTKGSTPRRLIELTALLLLVLTIAGCGGNDVVLATPTPEQTQQPDTETTIVEGGVLTVGIPTNISTFDPLLIDTKEVQSLLSLVYEPLLSYDSTCRLSPSLAETWNTNDGGVTWTVKLRRGVTWHGANDAMNANDVIYTYDVLRSDAYAESPYRGLLAAIADMEAVDEYTLTVTGTEAGMGALYSLTFPVVSSAHFSNNSGTGPYMLFAADSSQGVVLTANESWWKRTPYIKEINAICMNEGTTALSLLSIREANFAPSSSVTVSSAREEGVTNVHELYTQHAEMMFVNRSSWRLQDPNVVKAIAYALDRREIISRTYYNHAVAIDVPITPDSWLYDSSTKVYDTDVGKAIELLEASNWRDYDGDGIRDKREGESISTLRLTLLVNDTPDSMARKDVAALIKSQLAEVGIQVEIVTSPWSTDSQEYLTVLEAGGFDLALAGMYVDRSFDLSALIGTDGSRNYSGYASSTMDGLLQDAKNASSEQELRDAMLEIQREFIEDLPFIQLYFRTYSVAYTAELTTTTDLRDTEHFRGIERWHFSKRGRELYTGASIRATGVPGLTKPVINTPEPDEGEDGDN